jgi:hypothetical protein
MVLSSKIIEIGLESPVKAIHAAVLDALPRSEDLWGNRIIITVETLDKQRGKKKSALAQLEELIVDTVENSNTGTIWIQFEYRFCFLSREYFWNDKEIYITTNEALFLYRWLVLHDDTHKAQKYYLYAMRRRLGKNFLAEIVE